VKEGDKDDPVQDMMKEMMARIKKGTHLKSIKPKDDGSAPAMNELASLLTNLKRGQNSPKEANGVEPTAVPEFQKFKLKKISIDKGRVKHDEQQEDSELMKKLGKQKRVAEAADDMMGGNSSNVKESGTQAEVSEKQIIGNEKDVDSHVNNASSRISQSGQNSAVGDSGSSATLDSQGSLLSKQNNTSGIANEAINDDVSCNIEAANGHETQGSEVESQAVQSQSGEGNKGRTGSGIENATKAIDSVIDEINELLE